MLARRVSLVQVASDGPVNTVTLNRPESLNAVTGPLLLALLSALRSIRDDDGCRAIVLHGAGRAFCAGADLTVGLGPDVASMMQTMRTGTEVIQLLRDLPQPVVSAVHGHAVGAGFALAAASDLRVIDPDAVFSAPFVRLGMSAGDLGLSWLLPRQIGATRAAHLFFLGGSLDAEAARELGFASEVHPDPLAAATELAQTIAALPVSGVRETKSLLNASLAGDGFRRHLELEARTQVLLAFSGEFEQARARFSDRHTATPSQSGEDPRPLRGPAPAGTKET